MGDRLKVARADPIPVRTSHNVGRARGQAGFLHEAEREHLVSAALEPNGTTWSSLGAIYHRQGRLIEEIDAWQRAGALLSYPAPELLALGYAELAARRPQKALQTFDKAAASLSPRLTAAVGNSPLRQPRTRADHGLGCAGRFSTRHLVCGRDRHSETREIRGLAGALKIIRSRAAARRREASKGTCCIDQSRSGVADQTALTALKLNHRPGFLPAG
jgi:tetratricopeptide (TPR) repeat protein